MNYLHRIIFTIKTVIDVTPEIWKCSVCPIIHHHFVGVSNKKNYDIVWKELHKAHLAYEKKLKQQNEKRSA